MGRSKLAYIRRLVSRIKNTGDHQIVRHFLTPAWFRNRLNPTVPALAGCMSLCSLERGSIDLCCDVRQEHREAKVQREVWVIDLL